MKGRALVASELESAIWKKSTYSGGSESQCVEVADVTPTHSGIAIRDSKNPDGPALLLAPVSFAGFVSAVRAADFHV